MPRCQQSRKRLIAARQRKAAKRRAEMKRRRAGKKTLPASRRARRATSTAPETSPIGILGDLLAINGALHRLGRAR